MSRFSYFKTNEAGYVLFLALIGLPVFILFCVLIFDGARVTRTHSDITDAVDALAIAAAEELDRGPDAIDRAENAIKLMRNEIRLATPSMGIVNLVYQGSEDPVFDVHYLTDIPEYDDIPITPEFIALHETTDGTLANFAYIRADYSEFEPSLSFLGKQGDLNFSAEAVAGSQTTICHTVPLFICSPSEISDTEDFQTKFLSGAYHGRLIRLHPKGNVTASPGNFGFLRIGGETGAAVLKDFFASNGAPGCRAVNYVETEPGAATSVLDALNTRFDIYINNYKGGVLDYPPAANVRKGYLYTNPSKPCEGTPSTDPSLALGFSKNEVMNPAGTVVAGAAIGDGDWDYDDYWAINHPTRLKPGDEINSFPNAVYPASSTPSRYDVYNYEIEQGFIGDNSPGGETGDPVCYNSKAPQLPASNTPDRRVLFAALVDCTTYDVNGASAVPVTSYVSLFLARPINNLDGDETIDVEIIDIEGFQGNGTLETVFKREVFLAR